MYIDQIIGDTFTAIKDRPKLMLPSLLFIVIAVIIVLIGVVAVVASLPSSVLTSFSASSATAVILALWHLFPIIIAFFIILYLIGIYMLGAYVSLCSKLKGKPKQLSIMNSFSVASSRYLDLLAYSVMVLVFFIVVAAILILPVAFSAYGSVIKPLLNHSSIHHAAIASLLLETLAFGIVAFIAYVVMVILFYFGPTIVVLEKAGPLKALKKSVAIGKTDFLKILAFIVVNFIVVIVIQFVGQILGLIPFIGAIISIAIGIFISTYSELIPTMYYITVYRK